MCVCEIEDKRKGVGKEVKRGAYKEMRKENILLEKQKRTVDKTLLELSAHSLCKVFLLGRTEKEVERR